jgi:hypothetical protein
MQTFNEAISSFVPHDGVPTFSFDDGYELCIEPLLFDGQFYVALYKDKELLTDKIPCKKGKVMANPIEAEHVPTVTAADGAFVIDFPNGKSVELTQDEWLGLRVVQNALIYTEPVIQR